jgi:hypothetical protein
MVTPFEGQSTAIGRAGIEFEQVHRAVRPLADGMARLLADPLRRAALVRNGRAWVTRNLDQRISVACFADFYRQAAEGTLSPETLESTDLDYSQAGPPSKRAQPS